MEITREVREYAEGLGENERKALGMEAEAGKTAEEGMREMKDRYRVEGNQLYVTKALK